MPEIPLLSSGRVGGVEVYSKPDYLERPKRDYQPSEPEVETMRDIRQRVGALEDELFELHGTWYQVSLFKNGLQYSVFDYGEGHPLYVSDTPDGVVRAVYNVMQSVQLQSMAYFLDSPPRMKFRSVNEDGENVEEATVCSQIADHFERSVHIKQKRASVANWVSTIGNGVVFCGWDPLGGDVWEGMDKDGRMVSKMPGNWIFDVAPPYQFVIDPEAKHWTEMRWVIRRRRFSLDWLRAHFKNAKHIQENENAGDIAGNFELAWMQLNTRHGFAGRSQDVMPKGRGQTFIYELWEKPTVHHKRGRYIIMSEDEVLLHAGPNPTGKHLPTVFFKYYDVEGAFWGRSPQMDLIHLQLEINRRESQKSQHCNLLGNPPLCHYDNLDEDNVSNLVGRMLKLDPTMSYAPPFFLRMPELSATVREMVPEAMRFVDFVSGHFGPSRGEVMSQVKSGVQQMMLEEADSRNMRPMMNDWELGWEQVERLALILFQEYASLPRKVKVAGKNGQWRLRYMSKEDLGQDFDVEVVPGSSIPTSDSTMFTKMVTLLQAGAFNLQDPQDNQRFWEALKMGDMVRFVADKKVHREKQLREIDMLRRGIRPKVDTIGDDHQIHLDVLTSFIASPEFESASELTKALALLHRTEHLLPLQSALSMPTVDPSAFPMFGGGGDQQGAMQQGMGASEVGQIAPVGPGGPQVGPGSPTRGNPNVSEQP